MILLHCSDLHFGRSDAHDARASALLDAAHKRWPEATLVVTGDITDNGTDDQWVTAMDSIIAWPRRVLVPGNHDLGRDGWHGVDDAAFERTMRLCGWPTGRRTIWRELCCIDSTQHGGSFTSRGCGAADSLVLGWHLFGMERIHACHHDPTVDSPVEGAWLDWPGGRGLLAVLPAGSIVLCGHVGSECVVKTAERGITVCNMDGCVSAGKVAVVDTVAWTVEIVEVLK